MHWHMNERIDDNRPVNNGTARDRDVLADALLAVVPAFASLGWELTKWQIIGFGHTEVEFTCEDDCGNSHTLHMLIWRCECETGEMAMRSAEGRMVSSLN